MTSRHESPLSSAHAPLARMLAFVLLVLIIYGATAGAGHRHGNILPGNGVRASATFISSGNPASSYGDTGTSGECLMCRLHQHLLTGLLHNLPGFVLPLTDQAQARVSASSYFSQTNAPRRGRAPPLFTIL